MTTKQFTTYEFLRPCCMCAMTNLRKANNFDILQAPYYPVPSRPMLSQQPLSQQQQDAVQGHSTGQQSQSPQQEAPIEDAGIAPKFAGIPMEPASTATWIIMANMVDSLRGSGS